jgi:superfamily II DNA/RNA helicase
MYDPITSALISSSPALSGLDLGELPKRLTEAYAEIVASRISLRSPDGGTPERLAATLSMLRRLAIAHEAYVALLPGRDNRRAAAFVAGSAHQAILLSRLRGDIGFSRLEGYGIAAEVSASLLFLIADAHSDAAESAKKISVDPDLQGGVAGQLLVAIRLLCEGRLDTIRRLDEPTVSSEEPADRAVEVLYLELFKGVRRLAARMLTRIDLVVERGGVEPPSQFFTRVRDAGREELDSIPGVEQTVFSSFPGPVHLAKLLLAVDRDLGESALARVPPPDGTEPEGWWPVVRRMARRRPYLWSNHKHAIATGYLSPGVSAVMSFPTGGGKSTLAQLKIASYLLAEKKVVFLAPTHALVDQTTRDLRAVFNTFDIVADIEDEASVTDLVELPEVIVTTPERCLMLLSSQPEAFADLGLVVFDECHLLHPREDDRSRRSIDAMLSVLNLATIAKDADFLLISAMMRNAQEMSDWIGNLTGRTSVPLDVAWKPTRQVRGCVVYQATRIQELNDTLTAARRNKPKAKGVPTAVGKVLTAQPYGFFSLLQTWATRDREDYSLFGLVPEPHHLSTGRGTRGNWYLTPNGNHTSAVLAGASALAGMKTLVFVQTVVNAEAAAKEIKAELAQAPIALTDDEAAVLKLAAIELGGEQFLFLELDAAGAALCGAVSHHSLLLREERSAHESLFKRPNGSKVMVATSTVAQGMNFPAEVVLISGDSRFDPAKGKLAQLEAHELLNAAGRAGRAGENSQGFVLVVPSKVVEFNDNANSINRHWMTLQSIFGQSDQCLDIEDPFKDLLDRIHMGTLDGMSGYLLSRLPVAADGDDRLSGLVRKSLAAFRAHRRGDSDWVETTASLTGVPVPILDEISALFKDDVEEALPDAIARIFDWLDGTPGALFALLRPENIAGFFGTQFEKLETEAERGSLALPVLRSFLNLWMVGAPLCELERTYPDKPDMTHLKHARHFALRLVPDLAFMAGLPGRLRSAKIAVSEGEGTVPAHLLMLAAAVKEGADSPEALAVRLSMKPSARPTCRARFEALSQYFPVRATGESFEQTVDRFRQAVAMEALSTAD